MKIVAALSVILSTLVLVPIMIMLVVLFNGLAAMIVGWLFPTITDTIREATNQHYLTDFDIGAILGFIGSFFKSYPISK